MKYEDVIGLARAQDVPPHPGPDFMALMATCAQRNDQKRSRRWLLGGTAIAIATAAAAVLWLGPVQTSVQNVRDGSPDQAVMWPHAGDNLRHTVAKRPPPPRATTRARILAPSPALQAEGDTDDAGHEIHGPADRSTAEEIYRRAEDHMRRGKLGRARAELREILRQHRGYPHRGDVVADLARIEERMGHPQSAVCYYQRLATEHASHPLAADARRARSRLRDEAGVDPDRCR